MPNIFQVDSFTDKPFAGNPAAVCLLESAAEEDWMQNVAAEMNLAETAFVFPEDDSFRLRWFTPMVEVDLCGHATLATAHVLWELGRVAKDTPCVFQSKSGQLVATRVGDHIQLDFPAAPSTELTPPSGLIEALGVSPESVNYVGLSPFDYIVAVDSAKTVHQLSPDMKGLMNVGQRGVVVTAIDESGEFDFISRFFGPAVGIDEDPVTGSAHCTLGPYWMSKLGKNEFNAWQASPRGGGLRVTVEGDRVKLLGQAVTVLSGELLF